MIALIVLILTVPFLLTSIGPLLVADDDVCVRGRSRLHIDNFFPGR
jgi:hypothetical protein